MAFGLKKSDSDALAPQAELPSAPAPAFRAQPSSGDSMGLAGICLIVAAIVLLGTIASQFLAMKAMFVF